MGAARLFSGGAGGLVDAQTDPTSPLLLPLPINKLEGLDHGEARALRSKEAVRSTALPVLIVQRHHVDVVRVAVLLELLHLRPGLPRFETGEQTHDLDHDFDEVPCVAHGVLKLHLVTTAIKSQKLK